MPDSMPAAPSVPARNPILLQTLLVDVANKIGQARSHVLVLRSGVSPTNADELARVVATLEIAALSLSAAQGEVDAGRLPRPAVVPEPVRRAWGALRGALLMNEVPAKYRHLAQDFDDVIRTYSNPTA